jgi:hypothetical protein
VSFYKNDVAQILIEINNSLVKSNKVTIMLGVLFHIKLTWAQQVELPIKSIQGAKYNQTCQKTF